MGLYTSGTQATAGYTGRTGNWRPHEPSVFNLPFLKWHRYPEDSRDPTGGPGYPNSLAIGRVPRALAEM